MASNAEENQFPGMRTFASAGNLPAETADLPSTPTTTHFPLRKAISKRVWKIWGAGVVGLAVGATVLMAGFFATKNPSFFGPGFAHLFDLNSGRAIRFLSSLHIFLAGQLAALIWWGRSRSLQDFAGKYRIWAWLAGVCVLFSFLIGTDAHHAVNQTFRWLSNRDWGNRVLLVWMAPTMACIATFLCMLHGEMRGCRSSLTLLWMAALTWTTAGAITLAGGIPSDALTARITEAAILLLGYWCLSMSLLFHARFVVYESAEPPKRQSGRLKWQLPRIQIPRFRLNFKKSAQEVNENEAPANRKKRIRNEKKTTEDVETESPKKAKQRRKAKPIAAAADLNKEIADEPEPPLVRQSQKTKSSRKLRNDPAESNDAEKIDEYSLKGLSKRERKKLRKQMRDNQREKQMR